MDWLKEYIGQGVAASIVGTAVTKVLDKVPDDEMWEIMWVSAWQVGGANLTITFGMYRDGTFVGLVTSATLAANGGQSANPQAFLRSGDAPAIYFASAGTAGLVTFRVSARRYKRPPG
jgi:hypothetical protein